MHRKSFLNGIVLIVLCGFASAPAVSATPNAAIEWLDRIAVIVNDDVVMESDVTARLADIHTRMNERSITPPPPDILRTQVLERLITESIQLQLGARMGIRIDDETLNGAVAGIARQGNMTLRDFVAQLNADGLDYGAFREQIRRDMIITRVRQRRVGDRIRMNDADVEEFLKSPAARDMFSDSYRIAHILVAVPEAAGVEQVKAAEEKVARLLSEARAGADFADLAARNSDAANALEGGDLGWRTSARLPSIFAGVVINMKPGDIAGPLRSGSGFHLVKMMERKGDAQRMVQQSRLRHVLVKLSAIRNSSDARELAKQLRARVVAGEDFAAVAKRHSEDFGSALAGGDLGWVSPGQMVEEFETIANATAVGTLSDVFETQYGWHFLQVLERRDQDTTDEFRRLQARNAVWKRKFDVELDNWLHEIRNEAWVDIKDPGSPP